MSKLSGKKYLWALPLVVIVLVLAMVFKPDSSGQTSSKTPPADASLHKIVIAIPDLSSGKDNSSGSMLVDYLYSNKILEQRLKDQHIQVEYQFFKGAGPAINEALANKQLDFAFLGDLAAIIGKANGTDTTLLAATARSIHTYLGVVPNQGLDSLEKLRGKRIAIWRGTAHQLAFDQYIHAHGYSEKDFRIINLDPAATNAALAAKQVDAGWGLIPILALQQKGLVDIIAGSANSKDGQGTIQAGLIARSELVRQHPEIVQQVVTAVIQAAHWVSQPEHREQAIDLVTKNASYPKPLYTLSFEGQDLKRYHSPQLDAYFLEHFQSGVDMAVQARLIPRGFDVKQWADNSFVEKGIQQLNQQKYWTAPESSRD